MWPERFAVQELWLRSRRCLFSALDGAGVLPDEAALASYMHGQATCGRARLAALGARLGAAEQRYLASELVGGAASHSFVRRLPFGFAFGYELARSLGAISGAAFDDAVERAADAAGVFNLAASLLDRLTDHTGDGDAVTALLSRDRLARLCRGRAHVDALRAELDALPMSELRLFGALIAELFRAAHELHAATGNGAAWHGFVEELLGAYRAQLATVEPAAPAQPLAASRAKSVAPFLVEAQLAALARPDGIAPRRLVEAIGDVFWRVDDLIDLHADARAGQLNSVQVRAGGAFADAHGAALRVLATDGVEAVAGEIALGVAGVRAQLAELGAPAAARAALLDWLVMYVVDWAR